MTTTTTERMTHTLDVADATLTYDVRPAGESSEPVLLMIASPMGAAGFGTLSSHFTDRTVVTYDPRGSERSKTADPASPSGPDEHADDLHRLISALDAEAVDIFASSGGAVNALVLVPKHPEQVRTLIAHEPPAVTALPDRDAALAAAEAVHRTYMRSGFGAGMAHFIALSSLNGPIPAGFADLPAPDPAMFGLPTEDDGSRDEPLMSQTIMSATHYQLDFDALRAASTRIVLAAGAESEGTLASRAAVAVAARLGTEPVIFPSNHAGFLGGEYGQRGDPDAFAAKLREVLAGET